MTAPSDRCPACGAERADGHCPRCPIRLGLAGAVRSPGPADSPTATLRPVPMPRTDGTGVLETLDATIGAVPRVLLHDTYVGTEAPDVRPGPGLGTAGAMVRYQILGEVARGGMGAVLKGREPGLGRDAALKVLMEGHKDNPELVRRFVEEAQIGGQLQHPGVVPVYGLGAFDDDRPYFAMKLVKGRTLAHLLGERATPATDLGRFLGIFEQAAQRVAYAHARGVIHRDLKPSNVMVGSFGDVQVMDWGLAKVLTRGGVSDDALAGKTHSQETVVATARSGGDSDVDLSRPGSVLGTPSYMAPERARGEVGAVDERADVFALGSISCDVLTGAPAFVGRTSGEIQRKAARGVLADASARLDASGADAELVAPTRGCLAPEPDDRPREAGVVAGRLTAHLVGVQDRLRRAELGRVEERARRRLTTVAAAAAVLLMATIGGGYSWTQAKRAGRLARTALALDEALSDASRLGGEARAAPAGDLSAWAKALAAAQRADDLLAQGDVDAVRRGRVVALMSQLRGEQAEAEAKARRLEVDRALLAKLETTRLARAEHGEPKRPDAEDAAAFRDAGLDLDAAEPAKAGVWPAARSESVDLAS